MVVVVERHARRHQTGDDALGLRRRADSLNSPIGDRTAEGASYRTAPRLRSREKDTVPKMADGRGISTTDPSVIRRFTNRADEASSIVHQLASVDAIAALAEHLAGGARPNAAPPAAIALSPMTAHRYPGLVTRLGASARTIDDAAVASDVADTPVGIVVGDLAIAETGTVLIDDDRLADRYVTMLSLIVIQIVDVSALRPGLDDAGEWLRVRVGRRGFTHLVTGPSRTADIERQLTIGVQGPDEVHVVLLDDTSGRGS